MIPPELPSGPSGRALPLRERLLALLAGVAGDGPRLRTAVSLLLVRAGTLAVAFAAQVLLARMLGVAAYGQFAALVAAAIIASFALRAGGDSIVLRELAPLWAAGDRTGVRQVLRFAHRRLTGVLLLGAVAIAVWWWWAPGPGTAGLVVLAIAGLMALNQLAQAMLRGVERPVRSQLPDLLQRPLLVLALGLAWWWTGGADAALAVAALLGAMLGTLVLAWSLAPRGLAGAAAPIPADQVRVWRAAAWPLAIWAVLQVALRQLDLVALGVLAPAEEAGAYAAASRVAELVVLGTMVVDVYGAAAISRLWQAGDLPGLQALLHQLARVATAVAVALAALILLAGEQVLGLFGAEFTAALLPLWLLVGFQVLNAGMGSVSLLLAMAGEERAAAVSAAAAVVVTAGLLLVLVPLYGGLGAALATGSGLLLWKAGMLLWAWRRLGVSPLPVGGVPPGFGGVVP